MSGLFEKDLRILLQRKMSLLLMLVVALVVGFSTGTSFILGYAPMLGMLMAVGTISYDEMEHGFTFLFTLPINHKTYVREKYAFVGFMALVSLGISYVMCPIVNYMKGEPTAVPEMLGIGITSTFVLFVFFAVLIPLELKYGAEKSRIITLCIGGVIGAIIMIAGQQVDNINPYFEWLETCTFFELFLPVAFLTVLATGISYLCSCKVMKNKVL
ncbi:MAG: ABC-2 transporter permease [Lachnospiraceae bacterium]